MGERERGGAGSAGGAAGAAGAGGMPPECLRLAAALRELRRRTGLSLAGLGRRTPYSKSSWGRYLNGRKPVPRQAVVALCALAREPDARLLALWELADAAWSGRSARAGRGDGPAVRPAPGTATEPTATTGPTAPGSRRTRRTRRTRLQLVAAAALVALGAAAAGLVLTDRDGDGDGREGRSGTRSAAGPGPYVPRCAGDRCEGEDPARMGCGGPGQVTSLATREFGAGRRVELRYAKACGAVWARAEGLLPGDRVVVVLPGARAKEVRAAGAGDARRYLATRMTALGGVGPPAAEVCLTPADGGAKACFSS